MQLEKQEFEFNIIIWTIVRLKLTARLSISFDEK